MNHTDAPNINQQTGGRALQQQRTHLAVPPRSQSAALCIPGVR